MDMFCNQCQEAARNEGCTRRGVCGKPAPVANAQDGLVYLLRGLSEVAVRARLAGITDPEADLLVAEALFATITNANFHDARFVELAARVLEHREGLRARLASTRQVGAEQGLSPAATCGRRSPERPNPGRQGTRAPRCPCRRGRRHNLPPRVAALRAEGPGRLHRPRLRAGQPERGPAGLPPGGARGHGQRRAERRGPGRLGAALRRDGRPGHGPARRGQHRRLRPPRADPGEPRRARGAGHLGQRARPARPGRAARADRRYRRKACTPTGRCCRPTPTRR